MSPYRRQRFRRIVNRQHTSGGRYSGILNSGVGVNFFPAFYIIFLPALTESGTEYPYQNEFWNHFAKGIYVDIVTGEPLFSSTDKYESSCGWPAFTKPIEEPSIVEIEDNSHGMQRVEVRSRAGNSHLGHVFENDPESPNGIRYCINSASLRFIPYDEMEAEGYG